MAASCALVKTVRGYGVGIGEGDSTSVFQLNKTVNAYRSSRTQDDALDSCFLLDLVIPFCGRALYEEC